MESVGETLRRIREERGIPLEEIAKTTHVRKEHLEALEEDRFEVFPARAYVVGFLRLYAQALELNDEEILRRFREDRGEETPDSGQLWGDEEEEEKESPVPLLVLIGLLLVVVVIAALLYLK